MVITKLYIRNFRNIREAELDFDSSLNIFVGKNAQGKTNLMEAISVCLGGSFRHVRYTQYVPVNVPGRRCLSGSVSEMMIIQGVKISLNIQ